VHAGEALRADDARLQLTREHWKLHDIVIVPVTGDDEDTEGEPASPDRSGTAPSPSAR
jgi:hypothetical protein